MAKKAWIPRPDLCPWAIRSKSVVRKLSVTGLTESRLRMCEAYSLFEIKHSSGSSSRGSAEHSSEEPGHSLRQKAQKSGDCNLKAPSDSHAAQAHQPDARMPMHPRSWLLNQSSEAVLARAELSDTLAILAALCQFLSDPTRNGRYVPALWSLSHALNAWVYGLVLPVVNTTFSFQAANSFAKLSAEAASAGFNAPCSRLDRVWYVKALFPPSRCLSFSFQGFYVPPLGGD